MKKKLTLLLGILCVCLSFTQAQLSGKVIDIEKKEPLAGARVEIPGKASVITDEQGNFKLDCNGNAEIRVSYAGYGSFTQQVACKSGLVITLIPAFKDLEAAEVTASSNPGRSQLEQPYSMVRLRETELRRGTGIYMDDAINSNVPGVLMVKRSHSGSQQLNIRGYGNGIGVRGINGNFDSQGLKMYLNGIPVTDAEGITVMDDIDFGSIGNVEILKGPSGTLYGFAIAGVVNLQTQKAEKDKTSIAQDILVGKNGLFRSTTRLAIGGKNSSVLLNYGHQEFDGYIPHTAAHKDFVNMMGDFTLNDRQTLTTYVGYSDSYDQRNGELTIQQYQNHDYSGNPAYIKNDAHSAVRTFRAGIGHTMKITKNFSNTTSLFGAGQNMDNSSAGGWTDKIPVNYGFRSTFDNTFKLSGNTTLTGITGIEMQKMNAHTIGYGMGADSTNLSGYNIITSTRSNQATTNANSSYFTQWTLHLDHGISISAGIGISNMSLKLVDRLWAPANNQPTNTKQKVFANKYNGLTSPTFSINKTFNDVASVYASYSVAYKAPVSANILIATTGQVNTGLKPEKGTQFEIGTKGSLFGNHLFYTIAAFHAKFENKFTAVAVPNPANSATLYTYIVNAGTLKNNGIEVLAKYNVIESGTGFFRVIRPFVNMTISDFTYGDYKYQRVGKNAQNKDTTLTEDYTGNQVAGVAPFVFNAGVDVDTKPGLYGNINFNYRSSMYFTSDEKNKASGFKLFNAKVGFRKSVERFTFDVFAGATNLGGTQYYQMIFVNQLPDSYIPAYDKADVFGGASVKFTF